MREMPETEADFIEPSEQLTVQDILDEAEDTKYHTILEIWREVMKPAQQERLKKITPQWANRITGSYREVSFRDMNIFKNLYFNKIDEFRAVLDDEISTDAECLNLTSPEEDARLNGFHYLNVLINWQRTLMYWELNWDCSDLSAGCEIAAISEVHRMVFGENGMTGLLDAINFEFTDADRELLAASLQELKDAQEGQ